MSPRLSPGRSRSSPGCTRRGSCWRATALGIALWRLPLPRRHLVSDVLAIGLVVNLADFVASAIPSTPFDARELVGVLPYGAVLASRIFGPWLMSGRSPRPPSPRHRPLAV